MKLVHMYPPVGKKDKWRSTVFCVHKFSSLGSLQPASPNWAWANSPGDRWHPRTEASRGYSPGTVWRWPASSSSIFWDEAYDIFFGKNIYTNGPFVHHFSSTWHHEFNSPWHWQAIHLVPKRAMVLSLFIDRVHTVAPAAFQGPKKILGSKIFSKLHPIFLLFFLSVFVLKKTRQ